MRASLEKSMHGSIGFGQHCNGITLLLKDALLLHPLSKRECRPLQTLKQQSKSGGKGMTTWTKSSYAHPIRKKRSESVSRISSAESTNRSNCPKIKKNGKRNHLLTLFVT